jgi:hypothetical protein
MGRISKADKDQDNKEVGERERERQQSFNRLDKYFYQSENKKDTEFSHKMRIVSIQQTIIIVNDYNIVAIYI